MSKPKGVRLTAAQKQLAIQNWQRVQLSRFGANLPSVLQPLAAELGYVPQASSTRDQALAEDGWWSGGVHWVSRGSPESAKDLRRRDAADAIDFVSNWSPTDKGDFEEVHGLLHELRKAVADDPAWGEELVEVSLQDPIPVRVRAAILEGFRDSLNTRGQAASEAVASPQPFPWAQTLRLVNDAFADRETSDPRAEPATDGDQRTYADAAINTLMYATGSDVLQDNSTRIWDLLARARGLRLTWRGESPIKIQDVEGILVAALNTLSGQLVRATVNVALGEARRDREAGRTSGDVVRPELSRDVGEALDDFLSRALNPVSQRPATPAAYGALAMMGEYCPQICYLASGWLRENASRVFGDVTHPLQGPGWAAFITRAFFSNKVFPIARPFYLLSAQAVSDQKEGGRWSIAEGLGTHALISVLRGFTSVGPDVDEFVATTFRRIPAEDRAHAYWAIYRSWEDHESPIDTLLVQRLLTFWAWRLNELEAQSPSESRSTEAEGLLWFFLTDRVPAQLALDAAKRTVQLLDNRATAHLTLFERLAAISQNFPAAALEIAEMAVLSTLASEYSYIPKESLTVILDAALAKSDKKTRERAKFLVNRVSEATHDTSYLELLN